MSLSHLEPLVGKNVILFNYLRNPFKNKIHKMVENENEYVLYIDTKEVDRRQHKIAYPGIYFVTDVMAQGNIYTVYLKKQVDLSKFAVASPVTTSEYYVSSYRKTQYKTDGGFAFDAIEFEVGGFKHLMFNYYECVVAKVRNTASRRRLAVCLGDKVVVDDINDIVCNCDWFTVE